jgi:Rap1 GTPase-GDP dissociation stimulator 1
MTPQEVETLLQQEGSAAVGFSDVATAEQGRETRTQLLGEVLASIQMQWYQSAFELDGLAEKVADGSRDGEFLKTLRRFRVPFLRFCALVGDGSVQCSDWWIGLTNTVAEAWRLPLGDAGIVDFFLSVISVEKIPLPLKIHALRLIGNSCADTGKALVLSITVIWRFDDGR